ncbi:hypothetical protein BGW80DRAFT_1289810 [Lactifluus volemus]|nr:hypothetical protein BGW80DRAFT_1289810 [Lactifluus volemus]
MSMAAKRWADEVINAKDKATLTGEAKELEKEIDIRKEGLQRLQLAAEQYHKSIAKKKVPVSLDEPDKLLPREAFGITMVHHGEDFAEDSLFGQALVSFGRAFCNVATAQEALGRSLASSFIIALQRFLDQVKDYEAERKKLETRRLNKDAAMKQVERLENNKKAKEKDRLDAQEELEKSESRYDEAEADVQARMDAIQQNEIDQIRELGLFLDSELNYAEQYAQILRDVKDSWPGKQQLATLMEPRKPVGPIHEFARERAGSPKPKAGPGSRSHSPGSGYSEKDEPPQPRSRRGSVHSRAGSTRSRKRSDSQTTTGSVVEAAREKKGGWSVWSRSNTKKDREQFASLRDSEDDGDISDPEGMAGSPVQASKSSSLLSLGKWSRSQQSIASPRIPALGSRARGGELERQKLVRAVNDYRGSTDELSFHNGDEIVVIGEVIDGWMMGQLGDQKGLFPTVYTEPITSKSSSRADSDSKTDPPPAQRADTEDDDDVSHPFGDQHATAHDSASLSGGYSYDSESLAESAADESDHERSNLVQRRASNKDNHWGISNSDNAPAPSTSSGPAKKLPPPLPRRQTDVRKPPPPPPPPRRPDTGDCMSFVQAVGRATGMCANCQRMHLG